MGYNDINNLHSKKKKRLITDLSILLRINCYNIFTLYNWIILITKKGGRQ